MTPDWERARCAGRDVDFFPEVVDAATMGRPAGEATGAYRAAVDAAVAICTACPIRAACLAHHAALETGVPVHLRFGIVGGLTAGERAAADPLIPARPPCRLPGTSRGLRLHGSHPPCPPCAAHVDVLNERLARHGDVRERARRGESASHIGAALDMDPRTVRSIIRRPPRTPTQLANLHALNDVRREQFTARRAEFVADYLDLKAAGFGRSAIATALGYRSVNSLDKALLRARAHGQLDTGTAA